MDYKSFIEEYKSPLSINKNKLLNIGHEDVELLMSHYGVTPNEVRSMLKNIREWLKKQPHLPGEKIRDQQIIGHLFIRKFSVEKVKLNLESICYLPHRYPEIVDQNYPLHPVLAVFLKGGCCLPMSKKTPDNHRITIIRSIAEPPIDVNSNTMLNICKVIAMMAYYRVFNDAALGDCCIIDMEYVTLADSFHFNPNSILNILYSVNCFGSPLKNIHIINMPSYADIFLKIFKNLLKPKLSGRFQFNNKEDLVNLYPIECLPAEYGGKGGNCKDIADEWTKTLQSNEWNRFIIENSIVSDESKRMTQISVNEIFGVDGSFRHICID